MSTMHCVLLGEKLIFGSTVIHRPVHVPIGGLVKLTTSLVSCSREEKVCDPLTIFCSLF